jgi:hypothetical protein
MKKLYILTVTPHRQSPGKRLSAARPFFVIANVMAQAAKYIICLIGRSIWYGNLGRSKKAKRERVQGLVNAKTLADECRAVKRGTRCAGKQNL